MSKMVIYKSMNNTYCLTPEENYNARIMDAFKVSKWEGFETPEEIVEYSIKHYNALKEDFIIII